MSTAAPSPVPRPPPSYDQSSVSKEGPVPTRPIQKAWPKPRLRFRCDNLGHKAADVFEHHFNAVRLLQDTIDMVLSLLYHHGCDKSEIPPVRSITLVLREMDGVAYTTGNNDLGDSEHKEIHFNLNHITNTGPAEKRMASEIMGVLTHEMVHCWQYNAFGGAPSGLIEGIADFVRLHAGLSPPHWQRKIPERWDAGYQDTAYFLDHLEQRYGEGKVKELNGKLRNNGYSEEIWETVYDGKSVEQLFKEYCSSMKAE